MKDIVVTEYKYEPRLPVSFTESEDNIMLDTIEVTLKISAEGAYLLSFGPF